MQKRVKLPYLKHQFLEYHGCVEVIWVFIWNLEPKKGTTLVENCLRKIGVFFGIKYYHRLVKEISLDLLVLN